MDGGGCRSSSRRRVYGGRPIGYDENRVCVFWQQGNCRRNPCKFVHGQPQPTQSQSQSQVRKRPNPSSSDEHMSQKKKFIGTRNPTEEITKKEPIAKKKELCHHWASGNCVHGENCSDMHSWFTGSGFRFVANLEGHKKGITGVAFPTRSDKLFSGSEDGCLNVWDCNSGQLVFTAQLGNQIGCVIRSEEGAPWLFVGLENGVRAYKLDDHTQLHLTGPNGLVRSLTFDEKTRTLYGGVEDGSIFVWKVTPESSIDLVATYKGHQQAVVSLFVGKGVIFSASEDKTVRAWEIATWECCCVVNEHTAAVTSLLCWEDYLITASLDNSVKMWGNSAEDPTLKVLRQVEDDSGVLALRGIYDKEGKPILLCSRADNTLRLLELPTFTERGRIFTKGPVQSIAVETISKESTRLFFIGDAKGHLGVWRMDEES